MHVCRVQLWNRLEQWNGNAATLVTVGPEPLQLLFQRRVLFQTDRNSMGWNSSCRDKRHPLEHICTWIGVYRWNTDRAVAIEIEL